MYLYFLDDSQLGTAGARILSYLFGTGDDWFLGNEFALTLFSFVTEEVLHNPVLKRVEGDDCEASAWLQHGEPFIQAFLQVCQLFIHRNPQSLEGLGGWVELVVASGSWDHGF